MATSTAVDLTALARVVGIKTEFQDLRRNSVFYLPQRVMVVGQGSTTQTYSLVKQTFQRANDVGTVYGFGSPVHLAAKQLLPVNGDGLGTVPMTIYPLADAPGSIVAAGDITPVNAATEVGSYRVKVNNILSEAFIVDVGDTVPTIVTAMTTAINSTLDIPVVAVDATPGTSTECDITAKWKGESGNDLTLSVVGPTVGVTFTITQPVGGATNPDVDDVLVQVGEVWETCIVNCLNLSDTSTLDKFRTFGEGRWGSLTKKPLLVYTGTNVADMTTATAISAVRTTDRINTQVPAPGSDSLPFEIAARSVARIARVANNNPAQDYSRRTLSGIDAGTDEQQWNYSERDAAVKRGSSTTNTISGEVILDNTVTMYFPVGDPTPAYRKVVTIVKLQQVLFNLNLIFESDTWAGAPLIPDLQATTNATAKQPKDAVSSIASMIDALALDAIISDPVSSKQSIRANISGTNPDRLDVSFTVQISGNTDIVSVDFNFGFYFGESSLLA